MQKEILDYIKSQRVGVLAVEMLDGSPHAATVHFAHVDDPLVFFFETYSEYRKAEPLLKNGKARASFVIGSDESNMKTLQIDGTVEVLKDEERGTFDSVYLGKFPEKKGKASDGKFLCFKLVPTWWRFTDWIRSEGKLILTSG
jgi:uncharacterized protein YhbP (UPF0306 family)